MERSNNHNLSMIKGILSTWLKPTGKVDGDRTLTEIHFKGKKLKTASLELKHAD